MNNNLKLLDEETKSLLEVVNPNDVAIATAGILSAANISIMLGKVVKKAVTDSFQRAKQEHALGKAQSTESVKQSLVEKISDEISSFLKNYSETQKIISTGSFSFKEKSMMKIQDEIDKALSNFNFSEEDKLKIERRVFQKIKA